MVALLFKYSVHLLPHVSFSKKRHIDTINNDDSEAKGKRQSSKRSKGIRQLSINWCTSPMMIHKIITFVGTINGWNVWAVKNEPTNRNTVEVPKVVKPTNKKTIL